VIKLETSRFGVVEVAEERVINFPSGLAGFPDLRRYLLIDHKDTPLKWLQAVDDADIAFIVASPDVIAAGYSMNLDNTVRQYLQLENEDDLVVLVIMRVNGKEVIANFQGPVLINARVLRGVQVILDKPFIKMQKPQRVLS